MTPQPAQPSRSLLGVQTPTHLLLPADVAYHDDEELFALAAMVRLNLMEWQRDFLTNLTARRVLEDGSTKWAAPYAGLELSRQNGKSAVDEIVVLAALFVFRFPLTLFTAHRDRAAMEMFRRIERLIKSSRRLSREVATWRRANGQTAIELVTGERVMFMTRTAEGARSLSPQLVIVDEAQNATFEEMNALLPAIAAQTEEGDPLVLYTGSAGDRRSEVLGALVDRSTRELERRARGEEPLDTRFLMARWAADLDVDDPGAAETMAKTNPALGKLISLEYLQQQFLALNGPIDPRNFAQEHLGVGDYPRDESEEWVIPRSKVEAAIDNDSQPIGPVVFSVEIAWDRQSASICAAGRRADGRKHVELVAQAPGTMWAVEWLASRCAKWPNLGVVIDPGSETKSLIPALKDRNVTLHSLKTADLGAAWGLFFDGFMVDEPTLRILDEPRFIAQFADAQTRLISGATTWKRAGGSDRSALLAATWAAYFLDIAAPPPKPAAPSRTAPLKAVAPAATQHRSAPNFRSINF